MTDRDTEIAAGRALAEAVRTTSKTDAHVGQVLFAVLARYDAALAPRRPVNPSTRDAADS